MLSLEAATSIDSSVKADFVPDNSYFPILPNLPYPKDYPSIQIISRPTPEYTEPQNIADAYLTGQAEIYFNQKRAELTTKRVQLNAELDRIKTSARILRLAEAYRGGKVDAYFGALKQNPEARQEILNSPVIIKNVMDNTPVEQTATSTAFTPEAPITVPTTEEIMKEVSKETKGGRRWTNKISGAWESFKNSRIGKAVAYTSAAGAAIVAGLFAGAITKNDNSGSVIAQPVRDNASPNGTPSVDGGNFPGRFSGVDVVVNINGKPVTLKVGEDKSTGEETYTNAATGEKYTKKQYDSILSGSFNVPEVSQGQITPEATSTVTIGASENKPNANVTPVATATTEAFTPTPVPATPTRVPATRTPEPTKPAIAAEKSPADKLDTAIQLRKESINKGENKAALPESIINAGGQVKDFRLSNSGADIWYADNLPAGTAVNFPALVDGKVEDSRQVSSTNKLVRIKTPDGFQWDFRVPLYANLLVQKDQTVQMGTALFEITYQSNQQQRNFEQIAPGVPEGTAILIAGGKPGEPSRITLSQNALKDGSGQNVVIPSLTGK